MKEITLVIQNNRQQQVQLPLIQRLAMGPQYCTVNEQEAMQWLNWKLHTPYAGFRTYAESMKHSSKGFGVCGIDVPVDARNPQRPWIVNKIFEERGAILKGYAPEKALAGGRVVSESIHFTYQTNEVGEFFAGW